MIPSRFYGILWAFKYVKNLERMENLSTKFTPSSIEGLEIKEGKRMKLQSEYLPEIVYMLAFGPLAIAFITAFFFSSIHPYIAISGIIGSLTLYATAHLAYYNRRKKG